MSAMPSVDPMAVSAVRRLQFSASQQRALDFWTIYDRPKDYPHGVIARRHLLPGGPTEEMLVAPLEDLRAIFRAAGLTMAPRAPKDDVKIVETWI
jgi:hypothetical protein